MCVTAQALNTRTLCHRFSRNDLLSWTTVLLDISMIRSYSGSVFCCRLCLRSGCLCPRRVSIWIYPAGSRMWLVCCPYMWTMYQKPVSKWQNTSPLKHTLTFAMLSHCIRCTKACSQSLRKSYYLLYSKVKWITYIDKSTQMNEHSNNNNYVLCNVDVWWTFTVKFSVCLQRLRRMEWSHLMPDLPIGISGILQITGQKSFDPLKRDHSTAKWTR